MDEDQRNKTHKSRTTGNKAVHRDEQRKKKAGIDLEPNRGRNPKAFQGPSSGSHKSQQKMRSVEKKESVLHLPSDDKTLSHIVQEPPLLVAVVGPPNVGKSTLIRSMVKFYSGRNVQNVRGPITVVAGRSRRVTFLECPNTLAAMCDVAKVADLVLLMVDGSFGFEMETFEFLNIAQVHGFPKIFGVVSHLDQMKTSKALKKQKKFLRHRFWHEVAAGAKLLCLSPMLHNMYRQTDVLKLHRLLICVQPKIQQWRNTHSCVLIDRHEDVTPPEVIQEDPSGNRSIAFFGYARGKPMKADQMVHIPGLGDFTISHLVHQDDPCEYTHSNANSTSQGHRMRHLNQKQKRLYAPYCDVGGVMYDDDSIFIHEDAERLNIERTGEGVQLLKSLQTARPIDSVATKLQVVRRPVNFKNDDTMELDMDDPTMPRDESDTDDSSDDDVGARKKRGASDTFDLDDFGLGGKNAALEEDYSDMPTAIADDALAPRLPDAPDSIRITKPTRDWKDALLLMKVKELFITGSWKGANPTHQRSADDEDDSENAQLEDKGYDSNDEEFEREARGEVGIVTKQAADESAASSENEGALDDLEDDDGDDEDSENEAGPASGSTSRSNALAGIASSGLHGKGSVSGAASKHKSSLAVKRSQSKFETYNNNDDDEDEFDILKEDEASLQKNDFADSDLAGLVAHFTKPTSSLQDAEGIEVVDHKHLFTKQYTDAKAQDDEEALAETIQKGDELTEEQERLLKKRMAKKQAFDETYDVDGGKNNTMGYYHHLQQEVQQKKEDLDAAVKMAGDDVEQKIRLVGYFSGLYVRFVIENVPVEFLHQFDPTLPLIAGGLNFGEDQLQMVNAKVKRHRWYPKILKAQDPLLISIGWRRIQTQPIFAQEDPNGRLRYLKYTPLHMHCFCAFYAPIAPTNTGFVAIPVADARTTNFRCLATGYTIGNDSCTAVVKKLKLTGTPQKIEKTTAFIKSMFNSDIEAAKFIGAKLKTVSGIRGMVKAVIKGKNGLVRATFEDKILPSDIVFIRAWKPVDPPRFCVIMKNLLDRNWTGMKTMAQLRREHNVPLPIRPDSEYREIKRRRSVNEDEPQKVLISRNTRLNLPFDHKEEFIPLEKSSALQQRLVEATTVAPEPRELRKQALLDHFSDKTDAMDARRKEVKNAQRSRMKRAAEREEEEYEKKLKKAKKETARKQEFRSQHKSRK